MKEFFTAVLEPIGPSDSLTCVRIPFSVEHVFGKKGHVEVTGTLNGLTFEGALEAEGDGTHTMLIDEAVLKAAGVKAGDTVDFSVQMKN